MPIKEKQFHFPNAALLFQTLYALGLICTTCKSSYKLKHSTPSTQAVTNKNTGVLCNVFPLLARYSTLTQSSKLTLYQSLIRSILTYRSSCLEFHMWLRLPQTPCRPKQQLTSIVLSSHKSTTLLILNPFKTSSTDTQPIFFLIVPPIRTPGSTNRKLHLRQPEFYV
jgi:hypothetical protein